STKASAIPSTGPRPCSRKWSTRVAWAARPAGASTATPAAEGEYDMSEYVAPLQDMQFVLRELAGLDAVAGLPGHEEVNEELASAILEEAGKFASGVLSPLNVVGDREGARWNDGAVRTANGWREAYRQFAEGGWNALSCSTEFGGQGLPRVVSALVEEMWNGANVAFALCPMLTHGAIEALELRGSEAQKRSYLPKLVSGEWTGTMNLTEPQAG